jgi:hypothetical protein
LVFGDQKQGTALLLEANFLEFAKTPGSFSLGDWFFNYWHSLSEALQKAILRYGLTQYHRREFMKKLLAK